jgi:hypothetical protein
MKINKSPFLLSLTVGLFTLNLTAISAIAQETEVETETQVETTVENTETPKAPKRLRATFFEEERRLKFGDGLFLQSALDGAQNAFPDPAKIGNFNSDLIRNGTQQRGLLSVESLDEDDSNFLVTNFNDAETGTTLKFQDINRNSNDRTGVLTVHGTVIGDDGQVYNFNNVRADYIAGYSEQGDQVSAVLLVTDPNNPSQSILIEVDPVYAPEFQDRKRINNQPASLSIGLPTDR